MELSDITGPCMVRFVGETMWTEINVACLWRDHLGGVLCIEDVTGNFYNWANVIVIRKSRTNPSKEV